MTEFGVPPRPRHSVVGNLFLPDGGFPEFAAVAKHGNGARFRVSSCRGSQVRILAAAPLNNVLRRFRADALSLTWLLLLLLWASGIVGVLIVLFRGSVRFHRGRRLTFPRRAIRPFRG